MPTNLAPRLAFIVWMSLSFFALWVHELRAEPPAAPLNAQVASTTIQAQFGGPVISYPSELLGQPVPLFHRTFKRRISAQAYVSVSIVTKIVADPDRDGVSEVLLLIEEQRCKRKVCERIARLDVWSVRASGIIRTASHRLKMGSDESFQMLIVRNDRVMVLGEVDETDTGFKRDIEARFRYTSEGLVSVERVISEPYERSGC